MPRVRAAAEWTGRFTASLVVVGLFVAGWSQTMTLWGNSLPFTCGMIAAAVTGLVAACLPQTLRNVRGLAVVLLGLAAWTLLHPALGLWIQKLFRHLPADFLQSRWKEALLGYCAGLPLAAVPHALLVTAFRSAAAVLPRHLRPAWLPVVGLLGLLPIALMFVGDVRILASILFVMCAGSGCWLLWKPVPVSEPEVAPEPQNVPENTAWVERALLVLSGAAFAAVLGVERQLWLASPAIAFAALAGLLAGAIVSRQKWTGWGDDRPRLLSMGMGALVLAASLALLLGGFEQIVRLVLAMNAHGSRVVLLMLGRSALGALFAAGCGFAFGRATQIDLSGRNRAAVAVDAVAFVAGWLVLSASIFDLQMRLLIALSGSLAVAAVTYLLARKEWHGHRRTAVAAVPLALLCVFGLWNRHAANPATSARLLFSTQIASAAAESSDLKLLSALDDARLLDVRAGADATWTVWTRRGHLVQLRADGVIAGELNRRPQTAPHSPADVFAAAAALTAHPQPESVLVLGLRDSTTLATCLEFPLHSLTCIEQDSTLVDLVSEQRVAGGRPLTSDPRLSLCRQPLRLSLPALAAASYDVVIINELQPVARRARGLCTASAYRELARCLRPGGIVCQRFSYVDFGAQPVRDVARTLATVFPRVEMWESAPGELLFLASNTTGTVFNDELLERCERPHVRRVLGQIGWDWSIPLSLMTIDAGDVSTLLEQDSDCWTAADATTLYSLPAEVARWGAKWQEVHSLIHPVARPVLGRLEDSPEVDAVRKRLDDASEHRRIITEHPDHFWAYRRSLRKRLQERPRAKIVQVRHEGLKKEMHPEDQRRKDYLQVLGKAVMTPHPTREQIANVAQFAQPYDPLVTPFIHGELARLHDITESPDPTAKLPHLLHTISYATAYDRSVRDVVEALRILLDHPQAIPDPQERWDEINSLMELLKQRWILRSSTGKLSKYDPIDARETIETAKEALAFLKTDSGCSDLDPDYRQARCRVLERTLIRPLRAYQDEQTAKLRKIEERQAAEKQSNVVK